MITPLAAEALLRNEIASDTAVGKALLVLLQDSELQNYRQSAKTADPYMTAKIVGRGEGIHSIATRISPVKDAAQPGRSPETAVGNPT